MSLKKEDLVFVARSKGLAHTDSALWGMSVTALNKLIGKPTKDEVKAVTAQQELRKEYTSWTVAKLADKAKKMGIPYSGRTKGGVIDGILAAPHVTILTLADLDPDQKAFNERWNEKTQLVAAGPGAGKTTAICAHVLRVMKERPNARILLLAYNDGAEKVLTERLRMFGIKTANKKLVSSGQPGCYVLTFDKYGYWSRTVQEKNGCARATLDDVFDDEERPLSDSATEADEDPSGLAMGDFEEVTQVLEGLTLDDESPTEVDSPDNSEMAPPAAEFKRPRGAWAPRKNERGAKTDGEFKNGFRRSLESAALIEPLGEEIWDWLYVDESQDVMPLHATFIDQIVDSLKPRTEHFVGAGDPRQQLYPGAVWFSLLWASLAKKDQHILRYNHRSTPAIVNFLNKFSKLHFPLLHHEQICARKDDAKGCVNFSIANGVDAGNVAASIMAAHPPGDAYTISPISVRKFSSMPSKVKTEAIVNTLRQAMYTARPGSHTVVFDDHNPGVTLDPGSYAVGNSYRFKGTERKCVTIIQPDANYEKCGISRVALVKLLFVACSRARDELHILLNQAPKVGDVFAPLVPLQIGVQKKAETSKVVAPLGMLAVRDDLCSLECWDLPEPESIIDFEPLFISAQGDADFVGIFAEAHVATAAGVELKLPQMRPARTKGNRLCERPGVYRIGGKAGEAPGFEAVIAPARWKAFQSEFETLRGTFKTHPQYAFGAMKYTAQIGRPWTVSERLLKGKSAPEKTDLEVCASVIHGWLDGSPLVYSRRISHTITAHRSSLSLGTLLGEIDFAGESEETVTAVVEMKHAASSDAHIRQAAIYAAMAGTAEALLLNTKSGTAEKIASFEMTMVNDVARALLALKHATVAASRLPKRVTHIPANSTYIPVDVETDGKALCTEIGSIAYEVGTEKVLGCFARVAKGVTVSVGKDSGIFDTGLRVVDYAAARDDQEAMKAEFRQWVDKVSGIRTFLHWGGKDLEMLGIAKDSAGKPSLSIDVYNQFRAWLDICKSKRGANMKLGDAVAEVLGPLELFAAHRAFEDAVMTAAVFAAISNTDGIL